MKGLKIIIYKMKGQFLLYYYCQTLFLFTAMLKAEHETTQFQSGSSKTSIYIILNLITYTIPLFVLHAQTVNMYAVLGSYMQEDTLTVCSCYHMHRKLIFSWGLMHPPMCTYSSNQRLEFVMLVSRAGVRSGKQIVPYPNHRKSLTWPAPEHIPMTIERSTNNTIL